MPPPLLFFRPCTNPTYTTGTWDAVVSDYPLAQVHSLLTINLSWPYWPTRGEDRLQKSVHRVHPSSSPFSPGHGQGVIKWRNRTPGTEVRSEAAVWARGPGSVVDYSIRNSRLWRHRWLAELRWPAKEGEKGEGIGKATGRRQWRVVTGQLISLRRLSRRGLCF